MKSGFENNVEDMELMDASLSKLSKDELQRLVAKLQRRIAQYTKESENANDLSAAERLIESERKYRFLFENAPVGVFRSTLGGRLIDGKGRFP